MWILVVFFSVNGSIQAQELSQFGELADCKQAALVAKQVIATQPIHATCTYKKGQI